MMVYNCTLTWSSRERCYSKLMHENIIYHNVEMDGTTILQKAPHTNHSGAFEANYLKIFSFHVNSVYT